MTKIITIESLLDIQQNSDLLKLNTKHHKLIETLAKDNGFTLEDIYVENNINKTIDNLETILNKSEITGKELKKIVSNFKQHQYNLTIFELFKETSKKILSHQAKSEQSKLIEPLDIFNIIYATKNIKNLYGNEYISKTKDNFFDSLEDNIEIFLNENEEKSHFEYFSSLIENRDFNSITDEQKIEDFFYIS